VLKAFVACAQDHGGILAIIGHVRFFADG